MNTVNLIGRLTKDVEVKSGNNGKSIARTSIAVQRDYKNSEGKYDADFINLVAFGATADFLAKYFTKGSKIAVVGKIQTGSFTNRDNQKVYTFDVVVNSVEFVESKSNSNSGTQNKPAQAQPSSDDGFMNIPEGIEEELPFT